MSDAEPLRLAYRLCLGRMEVTEVAGEIFVFYGYGETGYIDRLGPDGKPTRTYDLPIGGPVGNDPKGYRRGAKRPLRELRDLAGPSADHLYVIAEMHEAGEAWSEYVFEYRDKRWVELDASASSLHLRGDKGVLAYYYDDWDRGSSFNLLTGSGHAPSLTPILEHAHRAGAGPGSLDESLGYAGIEVLDFAVARHGLVLAVVRYDNADDEEATPVGTWLMVWDRLGKLAAIHRLTEEVLEVYDAAGVEVDGDEGYVHFDSHQSDPQLLRWRAGKLEPIALPHFPGRKSIDKCLGLLGVDPQHRLWARCDEQLAYLDGEGWHSETLPRAMDEIAGIEQGRIWIVSEADSALWSRGEDGTWTRTPYVAERPGSEDVGEEKPWAILRVDSRGEPWLIRDFVHDSKFHSISYVYTLRPLEQTNPCR